MVAILLAVGVRISHPCEIDAINSCILYYGIDHLRYFSGYFTKPYP
jgi:hypothetical protein